MGSSTSRTWLQGDGNACLLLGEAHAAQAALREHQELAGETPFSSSAPSVPSTDKT